MNIVAVSLLALGVVVGAVGVAYAAKYAATLRHPPEDEEDEERRDRLGITAAALVIIGGLMCGVGILFR